jgi:hypothetical protein
MNGDTSWRTIERRPDKLVIRKQPNGLWQADLHWNAAGSEMGMTLGQYNSQVEAYREGVSAGEEWTMSISAPDLYGWEHFLLLPAVQDE